MSARGLDVDDDADLDDGLDAGTRGPKHREAQVVQAGLGLLADTSEVIRGRNLALDDAERTGPRLPHLGLVSLPIPGEDCVDDDRAAKWHREAAHSDTDPGYHPDTVALRVATLKACKSESEWLEGALPYSGGGVGAIVYGDREKVYADICGDRENLPACKN